MSRKLFCELGPFCYQISTQKERAIRLLQDAFGGARFASEVSAIPLPNTVKAHSSILVRKLHGVDLRLQENKVTNLRLACERINELEPLRNYRNLRVMHLASFSFDLSVADLYYTLCNGHTLVACTAAATNPAELFAFLQREQINLIVATPTFGRLLTLDSSVCAENFPVLACIYFCGEPLQPALAGRLLDRFPDLALLNAYGPTEATSAVCACRITKQMTAEPVLPIGTPEAFACTLRLEDGEIVLLGSSVTKGYLGGVTGGCSTEKEVPGYRTGDRGELRNGLLYCLGRSDRQIKYKGYRIELDDIESNLAALDMVKNCAVTAKQDGSGSVCSVAAFVVPSDDTVTAAALKKALVQRLPAYMIPRSIRLLPALPVNANGKTDRKVLMTL